jgi:hypothetical protein
MKANNLFAAHCSRQSNLSLTSDKPEPGISSANVFRSGAKSGAANLQLNK